VGGQDSQWFKNVLKTPTMGLAAHRRKYAGSATPIMEPAAVNGIADEFQAKYGQADVAKYYPNQDVVVAVSPM